MKRNSVINTLVVLAIIIIVSLFCVLTIRNFRDTDNVEIPESTIPQNQEPLIESAKTSHLFFGNPSNADLKNEDNFLLVNQFYASSYSRERAIPNWTAWKLSRNDIGKLERQNDFRPDDRLPNGWIKITPSDYFDKIYDRGHMCPSGDRTSSVEANSSTFLMTNQTPQHSDLNQGPWEKLESHCRGLIFKGNTLYIYAGNYGDRGLLRRKVTIPTNFWKIIVVIPKGTKPENFNANTRVIAVDMPNIEGIKEEDWHKYSTTIREIERKTGYDFFAAFAKNVQDSVELRFEPQKSPN
jgi:endonuclease G, mitochondrial